MDWSNEAIERTLRLDNGVGALLAGLYFFLLLRAWGRDRVDKRDRRDDGLE